MADFESLIRGALAKQDNASPQVRQAVYQSSRNALKRLVENNRSLTVEGVIAQQKKLEQAIGRVELEYTAPAAPQPSSLEASSPSLPVQPAMATAPQPPVAPPVNTGQVSYPAPMPGSQPDPAPLGEPIATAVALEATAEGQGENLAFGNSQIDVDRPQGSYYEEGVDQAEFDIGEEARIPAGFSRRRKIQRRIFWVLAVLLILAGIAWIAISIGQQLMGSRLLNPGESPALTENNGQVSATDFITVLQSGDTDSLQGAGAGSVEIVNQLSRDMVRLVSRREAGGASDKAQPFRLKLEPGVLERISGEQVTVEIFARSGQSGPAQFMVTCDFAGQAGCGRKRFRVGQQPQVSVFAFQMVNVENPRGDYFISLNTDTTSNSAETGTGDVLDIIYMRMRVNE